MVENTKVILRTVDLRRGNHVEENMSRVQVCRRNVGVLGRFSV
jgi:hypothetical protein